jgi:Ca2+-binding EF-hand superfamily protein
MTAKNILAFALVLLSVFSRIGALRADIDPDTLATLKSRFAAADKNGDGKLTREECQAGMPRIYRGFDKIDAGNKGYITLDQIVTFVASRE